MVKAVIFDLYGTLLKFPQAPSAYLTLMRDAAVSDLRSAMEAAMLHKLETLADLCLHLGVSAPANVADLEAEVNRETHAVEVYPDTLSTLHELMRVGVQIGVISNLASPYKKPFFDHSLDALVQTSVFSCDCGLLKPDPRIYQLALDYLGVVAVDAIMVGDSVKCDVEGPSVIGIAGIHLSREGVFRGTRAISSLNEVIQYAT